MQKLTFFFSILACNPNVISTVFAVLSPLTPERTAPHLFVLGCYACISFRFNLVLNLVLTEPEWIVPNMGRPVAVSLPLKAV